MSKISDLNEEMEKLLGDPVEFVDEDEENEYYYEEEDYYDEDEDDEYEDGEETDELKSNVNRSGQIKALSAKGILKITGKKGSKNRQKVFDPDGDPEKVKKFNSKSKNDVRVPSPPFKPVRVGKFTAPVNKGIKPTTPRGSKAKKAAKGLKKSQRSKAVKKIAARTKRK